MQTRWTKLVMPLVVFVLFGATGVVATSASGGTAELLVHFVLPGGDTECEMVDPNLLIGNVTCGIHRHRFKCVGLTCDIENAFSRRWTLQVTQTASVYRSRRPFGSAPTRVLRSGQSLAVGYFRCTSRAAGLTCGSLRSGHGFSLSKNNTSQRVF